MTSSWISIIHLGIYVGPVRYISRTEASKSLFRLAQPGKVDTLKMLPWLTHISYSMCANPPQDDCLQGMATSAYGGPEILAVSFDETRHEVNLSQK